MFDLTEGVVEKVEVLPAAQLSNRSARDVLEMMQDIIDEYGENTYLVYNNGVFTLYKVQKVDNI